MLAHPHRMVILLPCVGPVFFIDIVQFQLQTTVASFAVLCLQTGNDLSCSCQLLHSLWVVRHIEGHAGLAVFHLLHNILVDVIPVRGGIVQKFIKVLCVLDDKSADSQIQQAAGQRLDSLGGCINLDLCPVHILRPFCYPMSGGQAFCPPLPVILRPY